MNKIFFTIGFILIFNMQTCMAQVIGGNDFLYWQESQYVEIQNELEIIFKEENGFTVSGPLSPLMQHNSNIDEAFHALRVICHHNESLCEALTIIDNIPHLSLRQYFLQPEYEGVLAMHHCDGQQTPILFCTLQQTRYMIWYKDQVENPNIDTFTSEFQSYAKAILDYFDNLEDHMPFDPPRSIDFDLPSTCDLFPKEQTPLFSDADYHNLLSSHRVINWEYAHDITGFIPSDNLTNKLINNAPKFALQNKNQHLFQKHLQMLYESQGRDLIGRPFTKDTLIKAEPGRYLFTVAISGKARFAKISMTPQFNSHALLLLGEPTLCAGILTISDCHGKHLSKMNIFSEQYLFSPYAENIYEIITEDSDQYLFTIGHFLKVLQNERIPHDSMVVEKYTNDCG
jgi:hypothetical protein